MDPQTIGLVVVAVIGSAGGLWSLYQLVKAIFAPYAKKDALEAVGADVGELKTGLHNLRGRAVTFEAVKERKEEVDRRLDGLDDGVKALNVRVDVLKDTMHEGFGDIKDILLERLPKP